VNEPTTPGYAPRHDLASGTPGQHSTGQPLRASEWLIIAVGVLCTLAFVYGLRFKPGLTERGLVALGLLAVAGLVVWQRRRLGRLSVKAVILWLALLLPLAALVGPSAALPHLRQLFAFRMLVALLVFLAATWALATRGAFHSYAGRFFTLLGLWLGWLALTTVWAPDKGAALRYLATFALMLILVLAVASAGGSRTRLKVLTLILGFGYLLTVSVTLLEMFFGVRLATSSLLNAPENKQWSVTSFFYNPNNLATFLAMCWPFFFIVFFVTRRRWLWALGIAAMGLSVLALVHTGSRSSLLTIGLETVVALIYYARHGRGSRRAGIALGLAIIAGLAYLALNTTATGMLGQLRVNSLVQQTQEGQGSGATRMDLLRDGLTVGMQWGFAGVGPGNAEGLVKSGPNPVGIGNLHDWWLEVLVDGGLVAFALYVTFYLGLLVALVRIARHTTDALHRYLAVGTFLALVGYILGCLGPSSAISFAPMWILFGLALALVVRANRSARERAQ